MIGSSWRCVRPLLGPQLAANVVVNRPHERRKRRGAERSVDLIHDSAKRGQCGARLEDCGDISPTRRCRRERGLCSHCRCFPCAGAVPAGVFARGFRTPPRLSDERASGGPVSNFWHCRMIEADMGCEPRPLSSKGPRRGAASQARAGGKFVLSTLLATIALVAASTVSTRAQTNWTGQFSSNWFLSSNWDAGFPRQTTDAIINTVTPNSTAVTSPGALARNLTVGQNGTGMLTIQTGGTVADSLGTVGNGPLGLGTVTVSWSAARARAPLQSKTAAP
jgi:T5SS/PEP-CTERM-associated repeat protein